MKPKGHIAALVMLILIIRSRTERDLFKSELNIPMSRIAFIGYQNYIKDAQAFYWLNPLR
jgi:hypothetical protein